MESNLNISNSNFNHIDNGFINNFLINIINANINGVIVIDSKGTITLINDTAKKILHIDSDLDIQNKAFISQFKIFSIQKLVIQTFKQKKSISIKKEFGKNISNFLKITSKFFEVPLPNGITNYCVLFIEDITKVRKLELTRSRFVSNVTHELKTPLTSIKGFVETLKNGAMYDSKQAKHFLDIIDEESDRLSTLINDILLLSEIETRTKDSNVVSVNIKTLVDEVFLLLNTCARKNKIQLINNTILTHNIYINRNRFKQLLINLFDNAIKYNKPNGTVSITSNSNDDLVEIIISDTGIGISPKHIHRIFERFYRVDKQVSKEIGGTGLGLSIVKHTVNLYKGSIYVESNSTGSTFTISLPKKK